LSLAAPIQRALRFDIASNVTLLDVDTVRAARGCDAETVFALVEEGELAPAFNLALEPGSRRELRIWRGSLEADAQKRIPAEAAIAAAVFTTPEQLKAQPEHRVRAVQLEIGWCISASTTHRLCEQRELKAIKVGHTWWVQRQSAANFLRRRMEGAN